jgi:hypothetical protein
MNKTGILTKALAVIGALLVWFPIVATIVVTAAGWIEDRVFRLDYLMPAELAPAALIGGGILLWVALRARSRRGLIGWGLGLMLVMLVGGQVLAVVSGLASGAIEPAGWVWGLVMASLAIYTLVIVEIGVAGVLLVRDLSRFPEGQISEGASL